MIEIALERFPILDLRISILPLRFQGPIVVS